MNQSVEEINLSPLTKAIKKELFQVPWINWVISSLYFLCLILLDQIESEYTPLPIDSIEKRTQWIIKIMSVVVIGAIGVGFYLFSKIINKLKS